MSSFTSTAGFPATTLSAFTSLRTTLPAPTSASSPISTPGRMVLFAPMRARLRTVPPFTQSRYAGHWGCGSSVNTTRGPKKTASSIVTSSRKHPVWMRTPLPMRLPNSSEALVPTDTSSPMTLSSRMSAPCPVWRRAPMVVPP